MKALVLEDVGRLAYKEVPDPVLRPGEVLLKIKACGICSSDIPRIFITGTYHFPTIPGHEFAGEIIDCAADVDRSLLGKRAAVFPLLPCRECPSCKEEEYPRCAHYSYFGSRCDGAFAEYISVPIWNLVLCADQVPFSAAAMCEPASVAKHCVDLGGIRPGDTVAIVGTGTIALLAAMWVKNSGAARVVLVGRNPKKLDFAKRLGIEEGVNTSLPGAVEAFRGSTERGGADRVLECVGSAQSIATAVELCGKGGHIVLTGNPEGDITLPKNTYWKILRNELSIQGTWNSSYKLTVNNWKETVEAIENGRLDPTRLITQRFPLEEYETALAAVRDPKIFSVKVMFEM